MKKKNGILTNKPAYLGFSILELIKILKGEFWYDYVRLKYGKKAKFCHMDRCSFTVYIETNDIYKNIAKDVEKWSDTSNYELDRPDLKQRIKR